MWCSCWHCRVRLVCRPAGDALPSPLVTALFEALSFPVCLEDLQVNQALEAALLHLQRTHQLDLTSGGRYAGLYSLLAHPTAQIRAVVGCLAAHGTSWRALVFAASSRCGPERGMHEHWPRLCCRHTLTC